MMSSSRSNSHTTESHVVRLRRRRSQRGYSLAELSATVTIVGVLGTLATFSVKERVNEAHSVEAINMLGSLRRAVAAKAETSTGSGDMLQIGGRVGGFGGPLGLVDLLGKNDKADSDSGDSSADSSGTDSNGNGTNKDGGIDGDGNSGHGNNESGCDPDNPGSGGKCDGSSDGSGDDSGSNGNGSNKDGGIDGDGNNGHGNNDDGCDPDNPGKGGPQCSGDSDDSGGGDSGSGSGSSGSGSGSSGSDNVDMGTRLCGSADPIPSSFATVAGRLYQSSPNDWATGSSSSGWKCLQVALDGAQRYQYGYDLGAPTSGAPVDALPSGIAESSRFTGWARGDLDGDGRTSWFVMQGALVDGVLVTAPAISIIDQGE